MIIMGKALIFIAMMASLAMLTPLVLGDYACINDTYTNFSTTIAVSGNSIPISYPEYCPFNCTTATGECNPSPYDTSNNVVFFIMPLISFILLYFTSLLKEEDWMIHILLMVAALVFLIVPMGILSSVLTAQYLGVYIFLVVIAFVIIFYYILKVIVRAFQATKAV
jgi:hypothetical protein